MNVIEITKAGASDVLKIKNVVDPSVNADEMKISVKAAGISFADILARQGLYKDAPPIPCVVGYEVSGVVTEIGKNVDQAWIGKEVMAFTRFGGYADTVVVHAGQVFEKPQSFSFEMAAAVPVNYITAWCLMVVMGSLKKGETILIQNAGGGVGIAAIDIAKHIGAKTIGTASQGKHQRLLERGLNTAIDYRDSNWTQKVMEATQNKGVDLIIDPLGPASWKKSFPLLRHCGRMGIFGASEMSSSSKFNKLAALKTALTMPFYHPLPLLDKNRGVFGVNMGHLWHERERTGEWFKDMMKGVEAGWLNPHVDKVFKFSEAALAHDYLEQRKNFGKVILIP